MPRVSPSGSWDVKRGGLKAMRAVAGGATVFHPAVTERLLRAGGTARTEADSPREQLTGREAEVVRLMAGGYLRAADAAPR